MSFSIARVSRLFLGMAFLAALSACGGSSPAPLANNSGAGPGSGSGATTPSQHLYVANGTQLLQYPLPITSTSTPSVTLSVPASLVAVDFNGNLAIADNAGHLLIYTAPISNSSTPSVTLANASTDLTRYVAFDPNGDLLAATLNQVNVYTQPLSSSSTVSQVVRPPDLMSITGMAVDGSGNLYMSSEGDSFNFTGMRFNDISAFAPPWTSAPVIVQLQSPDITPGPIAVSTTQLFVCNTVGLVSIYSLPFTGRGTGQGLQFPHQCLAMAADSSGNLYVTNALSNTINIYAPFSSSVPIMTLNANGNIAIGK